MFTLLVCTETFLLIELIHLIRVLCIGGTRQLFWEGLSRYFFKLKNKVKKKYLLCEINFVADTVHLRQRFFQFSKQFERFFSSWLSILWSIRLFLNQVEIASGLLGLENSQK